MQDPTAEQYMATMQAAFVDFRRELSRETDRGCALFAAAYLDQALSDLLFLSLVEHRNVESDLFEGTAPLATFSARIKMAFYLGKISASCRRDLDLIRKIRNDFAHHAKSLSFDSPAVADRCRSLEYSYHPKQHRPRGHFTAAACGILAKIQMIGLTSVAPVERPDDRPTDEEKEKVRQQIETLFDDNADVE